MNLSLPQVVAMGAGALLIYAAIKNQSPVTVLKSALSNSPIPASTPNQYVTANAAEHYAEAATRTMGSGSLATEDRGMTSTHSAPALPTKQMIVRTLKTGI